MRIYILIGLIFAIILISGCVQEGTNGIIPKTEGECIKQGGVWEKIGMRNIEQCNLPTSDAGKACNDSDQCEGTCIAENVQYVSKCSDTTLSTDGGKECDSDTDCEGTCYNFKCSMDKYTSDGGKECSEDNECEGWCSRFYPVETTGKCSEWKILVGCYSYVEDGKANTICAD